MANNIPKIIYGSGPTTITFDYPPSGDPLNEKLEGAGDESISADGTLQYSHRYIERTYKVKLEFVTKTDADAFRTFLQNSGLKRESFDYYQHSDGSALGTFTLDDKSVRIERVLPGASSDYLYTIEFTMREVI